MASSPCSRAFHAWSYSSQRSERHKSMSQHRLSVTAPDLYAALGEASEVQLNEITLICCRLAVKQAKLDNLIIVETMDDLEQGRVISPMAIAEVERLVNWLDDKYLREQESEDDRSELTFCMARAASSVWFASQAETKLAVEVVYEAVAAADDLERVRQLMMEVIVKRK